MPCCIASDKFQSAYLFSPLQVTKLLNRLLHKGEEKKNSVSEENDTSPVQRPVVLNASAQTWCWGRTGFKKWVNMYNFIYCFTCTMTFHLCTAACAHTNTFTCLCMHAHTENTFVNCVCWNDTALISISLPWVPLLFALGFAVGTIQHHRHKYKSGGKREKPRERDLGN